MLGTQRNLLFPKLVFVKIVNFSSFSDEKKSSLYSLNWQKFDEILNGERTLPNPLPEKYEKFIQSLQFTIPPHYKKEINRLSNLALSEWSIERHFDTNIREMCLDVAIQCVTCAMKLLSDCVYDEKTNFFYRKYDKFIIWHILVYRFWVYQTGRAIPWRNAELDRLQEKLDSDIFVFQNKEEQTITHTFLKDMYDFDRQAIEHMSEEPETIEITENE